MRGLAQALKIQASFFGHRFPHCLAFLYSILNQCSRGSTMTSDPGQGQASPFDTTVIDDSQQYDEAWQTREWESLEVEDDVDLLNNVAVAKTEGTSLPEQNYS